MTEKKPKISSLQPIVLPDNRRVTLEMVVENLPSPFGGGMDLLMPSMPGEPPQRPARPDPDGPSPYPNIELSVLDDRRREVASLFIVEHKEERTALTLHLPSANLAGQYIARAEMIYQDETVQVLETPFTLKPGD